MAKNKAYYEEVNMKNQLHLREILDELPPYCKQFFIGIEPTTASRTRLAYAYDLNCFFEFLHENNPICKKMKIKEIPIHILEELKATDIEEYLSYLKIYEKDGVAHSNDERGLKRKLSSLRSFYKYCYKHEMIDNNPAVKVSLPKIHDKNIIRLDVDEVAQLLDEVESGESLSKRQQMYHERTKKRDLALLSLMLGTGIRVSECVGLNLDDIDFKSLPEKFVLKCNNDSGGIVICKNKKDFDEAKAKSFLKERLKNNGYWYGREWPYKNVKPCIMAIFYHLAKRIALQTILRK